MRILIVTEAFGRNYYGVEQVLFKLNEELRLRGITCKVLASNIGDVSGTDVDIEKIPTDAFENKFRWHPDMRRFFVKMNKDFRPDIVHVHGVFTFVQQMAVHAAAGLQIPVLWSTHGMLEDWIWQQGNFLYNLGRRIYWTSLLRPVYAQASYVHVITELEARTLGKHFPHMPQIRIPNVVDFSQIPYQRDVIPDKQIVFLGRLHPVKGVDVLINAFSLANLKRNWRLTIAGPDHSPEYGQNLRQQVKDLGLKDQITFVGPVYGIQKYLLLQKAWVVVVPSISEVIAIVNLEAAAVSTPTITTHSTGLSDWEQSGGMLIEPKEDQLIQALSEVASWSLDERLKNGKKARQFVHERYSWNMIGQKWLEAYRMIKQRSPKVGL